MSDETYVDPNSGAAPQPGGFAGVEAAEKGFAIPAEQEVKNELSPAEYEAPGGNPDAGVLSVPEMGRADDPDAPSEEDQQKAEAFYNPKKVLADLDESGNVEAPEPGQDEEASTNASIEHEAVDPTNPDSVKSEYDPSQYGVEEVNTYLAENPDQRETVVAAEREGKNRKGITGGE